MTSSRALKRPPRFRSEAAERRFWETHDASDYVDWSKAREAVFPNLKPTTTTISLRLPDQLLNDLKALANKMDVPYQSLLKVLLSESLDRERGLRQSWTAMRLRDRQIRTRLPRRSARK